MATKKPIVVTKDTIRRKANANFKGKMMQNLGELAANVTDKARKIMEAHTKTTVVAHRKFLGGLKAFEGGEFEDFLDKVDAMKKPGRREDGGSGYLGKSKAGVPVFETSRVRDLFNRFKGSLNGALGETQQEHIDFNVVGQRALAVYLELENMDIMLKQSQQTKAEEVDTYGTEVHNIAGNLSDRLQTLKKGFNRMAQICDALTSMPKSKLENLGGKELGIAETAAAAKYFKAHNDQSSWLGSKDKKVDVMAGLAEQELEITRKQHEGQNEAEKVVGRLMKRLWTEEDFTLDDLNEVLGMREDDWADIDGSKTLRSEVETGLVSALLGKRTTYKSKTTAKGKNKTKSSALKGEQELISLRNKLASTKIVKVGTAKKGIESGAQTEYADVVKLKRLINKRLGAEIRRNMVRPALLNRTGRFSNSAQVTKLQETAKGIRGEYTYLLNPYQTFENTGSKKWPLGYNPKALITKSIRQLAIQYTETKFTQLRRL